MPLPSARTAVTALTTAAACLPALGLATPDAANLCKDAAVHAAQQTGVPYDVLLAIALVETGRGSRPWPWTVNLGGDGHWLDSAADAEDLVSQALDQGLTNIDLGCFQLNYHWHADAFASVAQMLDPEANALYAARYLMEHHAQSGDWATAAAAYHSATPEHASRYKARFESAWAGLDEQISDQTVLTASADRLNRFPLLTAGQSGSRGSLVPVITGGQRLIGGP